MRCRACHSDQMELMIDLGRQPIAHRLPPAPDAPEDQFPFALHLCGSCGLPQIVDPIPPEILYRDFNYCFSGWKPQPHIADEIERILAARPVAQAFEIGANDGLFLNALKERGVARPMGLEPNQVAGAIAREAGFTVYEDLLSDDLAHKVVADQGQMDMVCARQVLEHLGDIDGFFRAVDILLKPDGVLFVDIPDFGGGLRTGDVSVLWEEHVSYFTEPVLVALLRRHGFITTDAAHYDFSGGTLALVARRASHLEQEAESTVSVDPAILDLARSYGDRVHAYGAQLRDMLSDLRLQGRQVVLYGVGCRACTTVNGLQLGPLIDFAVDDQKERQGLFMPGSKLPIQATESLVNDERPRLVLLAVNNENENKVRARLASLLGSEPPTLSLQSPNDIAGLLDGIAARLAA